MHRSRAAAAAMTAVGVMMAACSSAPADDQVAATTIPPAPTTVTTTAPTTTTTTQPPSFVTTDNTIDLYEPMGSATHIVVVLHGLGSGPAQMSTLADRLRQDGAIVVAPRISLTSSTRAMGTPTSETACAVWFAHGLDPSLPIVMVGFSGGGLATGQYLADPTKVAEPELCTEPYEPTDVAGAVILDGPVWLTGYCTETGACDPEDAATQEFDPVEYAVPQPDLEMEYFISNDIADYPEEAAALLDAGLDIASPTTRSDTTHTGLLRPEFYDRYAEAVLRVAFGF